MQQRRSHSAANGSTKSTMVVEMGGDTDTTTTTTTMSDTNGFAETNGGSSSGPVFGRTVKRIKGNKTIQQKKKKKRIKEEQEQGRLAGLQKLKMKKKKKLVRNTAFSTHYGPELEALAISCGVCLIVFVTILYVFLQLFYASSSSSWLPKGFSSPEPYKLVYRIPYAMRRIGEKSVWYQLLRKEFDELLPEDGDRSVEAVKGLHKRIYNPIPIPDELYDVEDCPYDPPEGYPYQWNILDVLDHWPADEYQNPRDDIHMGLCRFDHSTDRDKILNYRALEVPFVVRGDPEVAWTAERWNAPTYMERLMNDVPHRCEYSINNHFMYWNKPEKDANSLRRQRKVRKFGMGMHITKPDNWTQPTEMMRMRYDDWIQHANVTDDLLGPDQPHWYYRLIGCGDMGYNCDKGSSEFLFDELTFFQPKPGGLYMVEEDKQKGIHCRFGMKGAIAGTCE